MKKSVFVFGPGVATLVVALAAAGTSAAWAQAEPMAPHRAIYELSLKKTGDGSDVNDVKGGIVFEFTATCDGYEVKHDFRMRMSSKEGVGIDRRTSFSSWESRDGTKFRFTTKTETSGEPTELYEGTAVLDAATKAGEVTLSKPNSKQVKLPSGTLFSTAHTFEVLDKAAKGEKFVFRTVFDGADGEKIYRANALIGLPREPAANAEPLLKKRGWPIKMAYFLATSQEPKPEYELSTVLYDNGIAGDMVLDYGDVVIDAKMTKLDSLPAPTCK